MNQLAEDVVAVQARERSFTYSWLLILIVLMDLIEPVNYQGMDLEVVKVCKGARYRNLWWVKEPNQLEGCAIQFWIYWELLQVSARKVPRLSEEAATKYQRIARFAIGTHAIHVEVRRDPNKQWLSMPYKLSDAESLEEI